MSDLARLDHALDARTSTCSVIMIEARRKPTRSFAETRTGGSDLSPLLPKTADFSLHLAVVPATRANGAPLDILVLGDKPPTDPVARVRLIGVLEADHTEGGRTRRNDHAVAVVEGSRLFGAVREIAHLDEDQFAALSRAWSAYNRQRTASFQVVARASAAEAVRLIDEGSVRDKPEPSMRPTLVSHPTAPDGGRVAS